MSPDLIFRWLLFGLGFWGCAELGHFLSFSAGPPFATYWPASGLSIAVLALTPKRQWPGYVAVAIVAGGLSRLLHGTSPVLAMAFCVANALEALAGGALLQLIHRRPFQAESLSDLLWLVSIGFASTLVGAAIGGTAVMLSGSSSSLTYNAGLWWMSSAVGVVSFSPMVLTLPTQLAWRRSCGTKVWLEAVAVGLLVIVSSLIAFGPKLGIQRSIPGYPFTVAPFLIWCGLRFGQFGTAVGVFLASVVAIWGTTRGFGLFATMETTLEMKAAALQIYVTLVTVSPLMFAAVIHRQRIAEDRLTENLKLLKAVMDGTNDAVFVKDLEGRYLLMNGAGARILGKAPGDVVGRDDWALFDAPTAERIRQQDQATIEKGQTQTFEVTSAINGGSQYVFHTTRGPYRDSDGQIVGVVGIARDISELKRAEQALQDANDQLERRVAGRTADLVSANEHLRQEMAERERAEERLREQQTQLAHASRLSNLGEMAAELAHEVNQPLSVISNYVRGTQRRLLAGSVSMTEIEPTLAIIGKEADRAAEVIRRIKSFVRKQSPSRTPLDVAAVVREALALVQLELRERQVQWELRLSDKIPKCRGDAIQLQQVIVNLVLNAADALESIPASQRRITVSLGRLEDSLEVAIADNGPGVSPLAEERIFEAFFSTKPQGLGLGLPISRGIIETHGGKLWAERCPLGGACLRFTLPVWEGPNDATEEPVVDRVRGG